MEGLFPRTKVLEESVADFSDYVDSGWVGDEDGLQRRSA